MERNIDEASSSDFRNKIKSLGFNEKGSELTSGGEINSAFLDVMTNLVTEWKKMGGNSCPLTFTSGNDKFHKQKKLGYVSRHTKGEAVDVTLPGGCHTSFIKLLNSYKTKYNGFSFIDEYRNPTSKATGGHFHMSYRAGQPEGGKDSQGNSYTDSPVTTTSSGEGSEEGDSLLKGILSTNLGLDKLTSGFANVQENIIRIKQLMK